MGARLPAHCTVAMLPRDELKQVLTGVRLEKLTARSIGDKEKLLRHLDEVRAQRFAFEESESNEDVSCVAAPVRDATGKTIAAISISVPMSRMTPDYHRRLKKLVIEGAGQFSLRLGYAGGTDA